MAIERVGRLEEVQCRADQMSLETQRKEKLGENSKENRNAYNVAIRENDVVGILAKGLQRDAVKFRNPVKKLCIDCIQTWLREPIPIVNNKFV